MEVEPLLLPPPAYILAGGQSRRFGSDKARCLLDSQPLIVRLLTQLQLGGHRVHVVADREDRFRDLGIECLVDSLPGAGPMAGLVTALDHCSRTTIEADWLLLLNCDLVAWQALWLQELTAATLSGKLPQKADVIAYCCDRVQPLPALYRVDLLQRARERLNADQRSIVDFLNGLNVVQLTTEKPPRMYSFNTAVELDEATRRLGIYARE